MRVGGANERKNKRVLSDETKKIGSHEKGMVMN